MKNLILLFALLVVAQTNAQDIAFVKDSLLETYIKSGKGNELFQPKGVVDANKKRQGKWSDYVVDRDFMYLMKDGRPIQIPGNYLLYGEGEFEDGSKTGKRQFYSIEDKTFHKFLYKEMTFSDKKANGKINYYYPNGKLACKGQYRNNQFDGWFESFYDDGKPYGKRFYTDGKRYGLHRYLYRNGKPELEINFEDDKKHGIYRSYYENGKLQEELNYSKGKEDGVYHYFYDSGQLWAEKEYRNGLLWNFTKSFDSKGKAVDLGTLKDGDGTCKLYDEKGRQYTTVTYAKGVEVKRDDVAPDPFSNR